LRFHVVARMFIIYYFLPAIHITSGHFVIRGDN
jgi:hypothetical protein